MKEAYLILDQENNFTTEGDPNPDIIWIRFNFLRNYSKNLVILNDSNTIIAGDYYLKKIGNPDLRRLCAPYVIVSGFKTNFIILKYKFLSKFNKLKTKIKYTIEIWKSK